MIARPLTRRAVVVGGILGSAALGGCSVSELTQRKVADPEAPDRARLARARDLSAHYLEQLESLTSADAVVVRLRAVHREHIAVFTRSAGLAPVPASTTPATTTAVTTATLVAREQDLAHSLGTLALQARRGDVAALLASASAGITQALVR
ncbi:MAG: hypothetical protein ACTHOG_03095 [Marmoricola sp.]